MINPRTEQDIQEAVRHLQSGNLSLSEETLLQILSNEPQHRDCLYFLAVISYKKNQYLKAINYLQQCLAYHADSRSYNLLGNILQDSGQIDSAVVAYKKAIDYEPDGYTWNNLGTAYRLLSRVDEAIDCYKMAISLMPFYPEAHNNLANIYIQKRCYDEAIAHYGIAVKLKPDYAEAVNNLGIAYHKLGLFDEAIKKFKLAADMDPNLASAKWLSFLSLPSLYKETDDIQRYRDKFLVGLDRLIQTINLNVPAQRRAALTGLGTSANFYLHYQGQNDLEVQRKYGLFSAQIAGSNYPDFSYEKKPLGKKISGKIKVGFVSSFFREHTIGRLFRGWIKKLNRNKFEVSVYYLDSHVDKFSEGFKDESDRYCQVFGSIDQIIKKISSDTQDVLIYTDIGMLPLVGILASLRLAPIQCAAWGHPVTTGLPTIDYFLSCDLMEPDNGQDHYSEKLIRLPGLSIFYCCPELPLNPKKRKDFNLEDKRFIYLSPQSIFKYLPQYDHLFPQIAGSVPNALFVFVPGAAPPLLTQFKKRLHLSFQEYGLDSEKYCRFMPILNRADYLSLNMVSDVLLDTVEWSGGNTTLEGVSCGLIPITLPSTMMRSRHTAAILQIMDMNNLIVSDEVGYVKIAATLGSEQGYFEKIKSKVKGNSHRLYECHVSLEGLENFILQAVVSSI